MIARFMFFYKPGVTIKQDSSSSNEENDHHESSSDVEDDGELALMMRKFTL